MSLCSLIQNFDVPEHLTPVEYACSYEVLERVKQCGMDYYHTYAHDYQQLVGYKDNVSLYWTITNQILEKHTSMETLDPDTIVPIFHNHYIPVTYSDIALPIQTPVDIPNSSIALTYIEWCMYKLTRDETLNWRRCLNHPGKLGYMLLLPYVMTRIIRTLYQFTDNDFSFVMSRLNSVGIASEIVSCGEDRYLRITTLHLTMVVPITGCDVSTINRLNCKHCLCQRSLTHNVFRILNMRQ